MPVMRTPTGETVNIDDANVDAAVSQGFRPVSVAEQVATAADQAQHPDSGVLGTVNAALTSGLATATGGASDVALRALLNKEQTQRLIDDRARHPIASIAGGIAGGALGIAAGVGPASWAQGAGAATAEALGEGAGFLGQLAARTAGGIVEGAGFGAQNAVSELALSNDPLTAEHVASALSSNVLFGGAVGGVAGAGSKLFERGLQIAGDKLAAASAARETMTSLPEDLRGLDDAGLKAARVEASAAHDADIAAEKQSLEQLRVNQRAELANQVKDLHENLATERPIFQALSSGGELEPALKGIDGVSDARVQLAKSYERLRSALDSPISVQRDPFPLIRPLEQRQAALEALQEKLPEMHAALAGDARASVLEHVDAALDETKQQVAAIRSISGREQLPLSSGRLTMLEAGPSARMQAIDAARDALKTGGELGMIDKAASGAAFAGGTALAHMIPGVGLAAPFVGKAAANAVETLFKRGASTIGAVEGKAAAAAGRFLGAARSLEPYVAPTATKVLSTVRFGPSSKEQPADDDLAALHRARTGELYQQTMQLPDGTTAMRPEARKAMAAKLDPIRQVNPPLADKIETFQARKVAYLAQVAPKLPDLPALQIGPDTSRAPDMKIREWGRAVRAAEDPESVEERLARGVCTPEEAQAYRACHPERFAALQKEIFQRTPLLEKTLPMQKKVALSIFTGIPVTPAMQPNVLSVLQATFDVEPGSEGGTQAPRPQAAFGKFGSLKDVDKPTPAQARAGGGQV
jgi:hypothetical protein